MVAVQAVADITEPDGSPAFTIFERTQANPLYLFDGTYSAQVSLTCTPGGAHGVCASLATTAACPALETLTVPNNVVLDSCGYLRQTSITDDGLYMGASTRYGIPGTVRCGEPGLPAIRNGRPVAQYNSPFYKAPQLMDEPLSSTSEAPRAGVLAGRVYVI